MPIVTQIQIRRGTAASWTSANPTLAAGEWGFETDTNKAKIGNGSTAWTSLAYIITGSAGTVTQIIAGTGLTGGTITTSGTIALSTPVSVANGGTGVTTSTGTGNVVLSASPTLSGTVTVSGQINMTATNAFGNLQDFQTLVLMGCID